MTQLTDSAGDACSVSHYRRVIEQAWSQQERVEPSTTTSSERPSVTPETHLENGTQQNLVTNPFIAREDTDEAQETTPGQLREPPHDEEDETDEYRFLQLSDSGCEETSCSLVGRSRKKSQRRSRKRTNNQCLRRGLDSSGSEQECCGEDDDTSDSSWDAEPCSTGKPRVRTHKQKMRKWKQLARGKFEEMLVECIVDTGEYLAAFHFTPQGLSPIVLGINSATELV
jgi:hypothetical protein